MNASRLRHTMAVTANAIVITIAIAVIMSVLAIGAALAVGYRPIVITGGSMAPAIPDRALVVAQPVDQVAVGDVVVMRGAGRATVTHRIVELEAGIDGGPLLAIIRGDANPQPDPTPYPVGERSLVARWIIPHLGGVVLSLATPFVGTALITVVTAILMAAALRRVWRPDTDDTNSYDRSEPADPTLPPSGRWNLRRPYALSAAAALVGGVVAAWAFYIDQSPVTANQFSTRECLDALISGVQRGQTVNPASGVQTVPIDPVDPDRSFLVFSVRSDSNEPDGSMVMGELAGSTSITFQRNSDSGGSSALTIEWSVVAYECGVSVQRGAVPADGSPRYDVPISPVDPSSSFVVGSWAPPDGSAQFSGDEMMVYELTSATNLRVTSEAISIPAGAQLGWQVVTFDDPADASVQNVSATLGIGVGTTTVTLATPVDSTATFLLSGPRANSFGPDIGERMVRVRLLDPTTIELHRSVTTSSITVGVQVVSLSDGTTVQHGLVTMGPSQTSAAVTIHPVDLARSSAFSTVMSPGALSGGATDHVADAVPGEASATAVLSDATTLDLERGASASTASFGWQVVTWGGPGWADTDQPFRQRLDVSAGAVDAPYGYATSVKVDHGALVDDGLSLASGDDLRLWRFDGVSWTELDRVLHPTSSWNRTDTTIWFRTQETIAAGYTVSYWLYFGDPAAGSPPADPDNVWLLREGFESDLGTFEDHTLGTGWYGADPWTRRVVLTVGAEAVDSTLSSQPVLVRITSSDLATHAQSDGSDIRFTAADGTTDLAHEIEAYDPVTGTLSAWVLVPSLDATLDTVVHLYYGAPDAPSQARPRQIWAADLAVWHLARSRTGAAPSLDDSSASQLDGLALGDTTLVDTASGPAADLDGTADRLEAGPGNLFDGPFTVSAWFRADTAAGSPVLVSQGDPASGGVFELAVVSGTPRLRLRLDGAVAELSGGTITPGDWHLLTASWDGSTAMIHVDGNPTGSTAASGTPADGSSIPLVLGGDAAGTRVVDGRIGEVRISNRVWSRSEIRFTDRNLRDPDATVIVAAPVAGSWFRSGAWTVRRPLTVAADLVEGPLADHPLLVQLVDAQLADTTQADGDDLMFVAADGSTRLDHELEAWDSGTGALTAWVRLPVSSDTVDTRLFLYLGNADAPNQEDPEGVWGPDADQFLRD